MKSLFPLLLSLVVLSACASQENDSTMAETADMADAQEVNLRPDADNPQPANLTWPQDWKTRFDRPSDDLVVIGDSSVADPDVFFTNMKPGWHITSKRPAGIYWNPNSTASGDYSVSSNIFLFDPGTRNEAFGLFVGGSDLNGESQSYLYFLIRKTGEDLVKGRKGEETENVVGWTANEVIVPWTDESETNIANVLAIETMGTMITFSVNGTEVHSMEKGDLPTDGIVGFRVNHGLNLHISSLDVVEAAG